MHISCLRFGYWAATASAALFVACSGSDFQSAGRPSDGGDTRADSESGSSSSSGGAGGGSGTSGGGTSTGGRRGGGGTAGTLSSGGAAGATSDGGSSGSGGALATGGDGNGGQGPATGGALGAGGMPGSGGAVTCSTQTTFYPDSDMDTFGRSTGTVVACTPPTTGTWATVGGDCDDDDGTVFPKEPTYFAKPHSTSGGNHSYDYDCSGAEEGDPSQPIAAKSCTQVISLGCTGTGYVATGMTPNPLCGSTSFSTCKAAGLGCAATSSQATAYRCK
jgi:hypothetical protein